MEEWLSGLWRKSKNIYVQSLILFIILLFAILGIISTLSDTGFSAEIQSQRRPLWLLSTLLALGIALVWLLAQIRRNKSKPFVRDAQTGKRYLIDLHRKAREIPDDNTFFYLADVLGIPQTEEIIEYSSSEIAKIRGDKLTPVDDWKPPLTESEKQEKRIRRLVQAALEKLDVRFDENEVPQQITVDLMNRGEAVLFIQNITFQLHKLPWNALTSSYPSIGAGVVNIPFDRSQANLPPGSHFTISLVLQTRFTRPEVDRMRGSIGFLMMDVVRDGMQVKKILFAL